MSEPEIDFDPTSNDARRERTERAVLARLAAIQAVGDSDSVVMAPSPPRYRWLAVGLAGAALAAAITLVIVRSDTRSERAAPSPSLVVTPVGGSSRFTVGDSVIEAGGDTSVEVTRGDGGETTLLLARGTVDCDVTPRAGRPPFRVVAGDVTVEVVGTRFAVARVGLTVRVDVTHGKVRVKSRTEQRVLGGGESWTPGIVAASDTGPHAPVPASVMTETPTSDPAGSSPEAIAIDAPSGAPEAARSQPVRPSPRTTFKTAEALERAGKEPEAARAYRTIANGKDVWAGLALYSLAELHAVKEPASALRDLDELVKRFPRGANAEDADWLRVDVLRKLKRDDHARKAAAAYLREYPNGTYVKAAARLAAP